MIRIVEKEQLKENGYILVNDFFEILKQTRGKITTVEWGHPKYNTLSVSVCNASCEVVNGVFTIGRGSPVEFYIRIADIKLIRKNGSKFRVETKDHNFIDIIF